MRKHIQGYAGVAGLHAWQEKEMAFLHLEGHKQEVLPAYFR